MTGVCEGVHAGVREGVCEGVRASERSNAQRRCGQLILIGMEMTFRAR